MRRRIFYASLLLLSTSVIASELCGEMETYDIPMGECMPIPMPGMTMRMLMLNVNAFGVYESEQGSRARDAVFSTNMVMADIGTSIGATHYLNLDFMGTAEKWTVPQSGYPLLLQIGENQANGQPFLDAQHPHSTPVMGLTLSDTIRITDDRLLKLFVAPRGESTDGPVAFMHRVTGRMDPEAPLGHHIGQDVGHITGSLIGGALKLGGTHLEASAFHGTEPEPTKVDLPIGNLNSFSFRVTQEFSDDHYVMASFAMVHQPEPDHPDVTSELRYSASLYDHFHLTETLSLDHALIYGAVTRYDSTTLLNSFADEFRLNRSRENLWGRVELLQRTPAELEVTSATPNTGEWVSAFTLGFTHEIFQTEDGYFGAGIAATKTLMPGDLIGAYGCDPWSGQVFLQLNGIAMWDL